MFSALQNYRVLLENVFRVRMSPEVLLPSDESTEKVVCYPSTTVAKNFSSFDWCAGRWQKLWSNRHVDIRHSSCLP